MTKRKIAFVAVYLFIGIVGIPNAAGYNQPPVVSDIRSSSLSIAQCESVELFGKAIDPDGGRVSLEWTIKQDGRDIYIGSGEKITLGMPYTGKSGDLEITLWAEDSIDPSIKVTSRIIISVVYSKWPAIDRIDISTPNSRNAVYAGEKFNLNAIIDSNSVSGKMSLKWSYDGNILSFSDDTISNPTVTVIYSPTKDYETYTTIKIKITNPCGKSAEKEISVAVREKPLNSPPVAKIIVPGNGIVNEDQTFTVDGSTSTTGSIGGSGFNEPEDSLTYGWICWEHYSGKALCYGSSGQINVRIADGGVLVDFWLRITDKYGATSDAFAQVFVNETQDDCPIADISATGDVAYLGENFSLDCSRSRDDREIATCAWTITAKFGDIAWKKEIVSKNLIAQYPFEQMNEYNIHLIVRDGSFHESPGVDKKIRVIKRPETKIAEIKTETTPAPGVFPAVVVTAAPPSPVQAPVYYTKESAKQTPATGAAIAVLVFIAAYLSKKQKI